MPQYPDSRRWNEVCANGRLLLQAIRTHGMEDQLIMLVQV